LVIDFGGRRGKTMKQLGQRSSFQGLHALFAVFDLSDRIAHNHPGSPSSSVLTCREGSG